ncbi:butyrophilin-like protein 3, partial [Silurus meridionalis]
ISCTSQNAVCLIVYRKILIVSIYMFSENTEQLQVVGPDAPLIAVAGEDLVLPCFIKAKTSAVDMTVEWYKPDRDHSLVHLYKDHGDTNENQAQTYKGRTSVFEEELQNGNASLKLSALRVSDEGEYRCLVENKSMSNETTVYVIVEVKGSPPVIMMESYDNSGGINLVCESRGWKPEPEVLWLDREGVTLPAEETQIHRDAEGFSVKRQITVYDYSDSNRFYCRLLQKHHMMETEKSATGGEFSSCTRFIQLLTRELGILTADLDHLFPASESTVPHQSFLESSAPPQDLPEISALLQALQDGSALPQDLLEISTLLQDLQKGLAPFQVLQESSAPFQVLQESSAPFQALQESSALLQALKESSTLLQVSTTGSSLSLSNPLSFSLSLSDPVSSSLSLSDPVSSSLSLSDPVSSSLSLRVPESSVLLQRVPESSVSLQRVPESLVPLQRVPESSVLLQVPDESWVSLQDSRPVPRQRIPENTFSSNGIPEHTTHLRDCERDVDLLPPGSTEGDGLPHSLPEGDSTFRSSASPKGSPELSTQLRDCERDVEPLPLASSKGDGSPHSLPRGDGSPHEHSEGEALSQTSASPKGSPEHSPQLRDCERDVEPLLLTSSEGDGSPHSLPKGDCLPHEHSGDEVTSQSSSSRSPWVMSGRSGPSWVTSIRSRLPGWSSLSLRSSPGLLCQSGSPRWKRLCSRHLGVASTRSRSPWWTFPRIRPPLRASLRSRAPWRTSLRRGRRSTPGLQGGVSPPPVSAEGVALLQVSRGSSLRLLSPPRASLRSRSPGESSLCLLSPPRASRRFGSPLRALLRFRSPPWASPPLPGLCRGLHPASGRLQGRLSVPGLRGGRLSTSCLRRACRPTSGPYWGCHSAPGLHEGHLSPSSPRSWSPSWAVLCFGTPLGSLSRSGSPRGWSLHLGPFLAVPGSMAVLADSPSPYPRYVLFDSESLSLSLSSREPRLFSDAPGIVPSIIRGR